MSPGDNAVSAAGTSLTATTTSIAIAIARRVPAIQLRTDLNNRAARLMLAGGIAQATAGVAVEHRTLLGQMHLQNPNTLP